MEHFIILLMFFSCAVMQLSVANGKTYHKNAFSGTPKDKVIQSEHYPETYPRDLNVTWEWNFKSGYWGVVFEDFDLDSDSATEGDWLELEDMQRVKLTYRASNRPVLPYMTTGSTLRIRFISDGVSKPNSRGFKLNILYGETERQLRIKIHDATKQKPAESNDESSSIHIIIIMAAVIFLLIAVIVIAIVISRVRKRNQNQLNRERNSLGVRKNSGISHCRRTDGQQHRSLTQTEQQQQQQHQQQHQPERPVQRSNSQLNWVARAELNTTIQTAGRLPKPNIYTQTSVTKDSACKGNAPEKSRDNRREESRRQERLYNNNNNTNYKAPQSSSTNDHMTRSISNPVNGAGHDAGSQPQSPMSLPPTMDRCLKIFTTTTSCARNVTRSYDCALNEYSDTVDSLSPRVMIDNNPPCDTNRHLQKPPGYDDHFLQAPPPPYERTDSIGSNQCYENLSVLPRQPITSSQTNIYINASGLSSSTGSVNRVTIDTTHSSRVSLGYQESMAAISNRPVRVQTEGTEAKPTNSAVCQKGNTAAVPVSTSSTVHHVDGYAYIIPTADQQEDQPALSCQAKADWSVHLDVVPGGVRASQLAGMQAEEETASSRQIYINLEKDSA